MAIDHLKAAHPGADAEQMTGAQETILARFLKDYGIEGVLEAISRESKIAIGWRFLSLAEQEEAGINDHCEWCGGSVDDMDEPCPHCGEEP